jgi:hypothetical protein
MQTANDAAFAAGRQYVQQQMSRGVRDDTILQTMVAEGWDPAMVHVIIAQLRAPQPYLPATPTAAGYRPRQMPQQPALNYYAPQQAQTKQYQASGGGGGQMLVGALICIVGVVITVGSYMAAGNGGGYVVAWGAIVFGAIRFFKGLAEMGR